MTPDVSSDGSTPRVGDTYWILLDNWWVTARRINDRGVHWEVSRTEYVDVIDALGPRIPSPAELMPGFTEEMVKETFKRRRMRMSLILETKPCSASS